MLLGWDGLGLRSYILVVYYQDYLSNASGSITLLRNRIGDILILISIRIIFIIINWNFSINSEIPILPLILLSLAACSKRAQFPFSAWLPIAIAAPTPISALVHSSTLVTAGVFILIRITTSFHYYTIIILIVLSTLTALYSSISANWEQDIKKIIALSTLRQIAIIIFAISINLFILTILHLLIHALFKSTIFLSAGTFIHESSYQDIRIIRINYINNPIALTIIRITSIALIGIPFISGFFSKDAIIENIITSKIKNIISIIIILSIGITANYSLRISIFSNKISIKSQPKSSNHSSIINYFPLIILAPLSIVSGTFLSWTLNSEQIFIISFHNKIIIIVTLLLGLITGSLLSFKNKKYQILGQHSLYIWAIHIISTWPIKKTSSIINTYINNDKLWQELYGPNQSFNISKNLSILNEFPKISFIIVSIILITIPILLIT